MMAGKRVGKMGVTTVDRMADRWDRKLVEKTVVQMADGWVAWKETMMAASMAELRVASRALTKVE